MTGKEKVMANVTAGLITGAAFIFHAHIGCLGNENTQMISVIVGMLIITASLANLNIFDSNYDYEKLSKESIDEINRIGDNLLLDEKDQT